MKFADENAAPFLWADVGCFHRLRKERNRMREKINKKMAEHVIIGLKKRNMEGYFCANKAEAQKLVLDMIGPEASVNWGGSRTVEELGLLDALREKGCTMLDYPPEEKVEMGSPSYSAAVGADYFLMSTNAITVNGDLVNIDGASNRTACLLHGPKHVIIIAGLNKLVKTVEDGIDRIRTSVCPVIGDATGRKIPCAMTGVCSDCHSPECMCCNIVITRHSRYNGRIKVILVGENLGM